MAPNTRFPWMRAALLALACAAVPGCQLWNAWLDALKWRGGDLGAKQPATPQEIKAINPNVASGAATPMIPRVMLYRLTVPVGSFTTNDKVWAQLNQDALDSKTAVLMAQNGLHAAVGSVARWPEIARLIDPTGTRQDPLVIQTDGRTSVSIKTRECLSEQTVFSVDHDNHLEGRTFPPCQNSFRLSVAGVRNKPALTVQLEPVVTLGAIQVSRPGLGFTNSGMTSEESFEDLRMATTLTAEQFLVVAAMDPKAGSNSVGALWLSDFDNAPSTETVLVFVPAQANSK